MKALLCDICKQKISLNTNYVQVVKVREKKFLFYHRCYEDLGNDPKSRMDVCYNCAQKICTNLDV